MTTQEKLAAAKKLIEQQHKALEKAYSAMAENNSPFDPTEWINDVLAVAAANAAYDDFIAVQPKTPRILGNDRHYTDCPAHQHRLDTRTGDHSEGCNCVPGDVYQDLAEEAKVGADGHDEGCPYAKWAKNPYFGWNKNPLAPAASAIDLQRKERDEA